VDEIRHHYFLVCVVLIYFRGAKRIGMSSSYSPGVWGFACGCAYLYGGYRTFKARKHGHEDFAPEDSDSDYDYDEQRDQDGGRTETTSRWLKFWSIAGTLHGVVGLTGSAPSALQAVFVACLLLPKEGDRITEYVYRRVMVPAASFLDQNVVSKTGRAKTLAASLVSRAMRWGAGASLEPALRGMDVPSLKTFRKELRGCLSGVKREQRRRRTAAFQRVKQDQDRVLSRKFGTSASERKRSDDDDSEDELLDQVLETSVGESTDEMMPEYDEGSVYGMLRRRMRGLNPRTEPRKKRQTIGVYRRGGGTPM